MSGSGLGKIFKITTFGESHGTALGVVIDGCPAGLSLSEDDITPMLQRRRGGMSKFTTPRSEADKVEILSGVFEGRTTGTPIALVFYNESQRSKDYSSIAEVFRPGHADFGFYSKFGFRDYRGGGRSSGRETIARVGAGAIAKKLLKELGIDIYAYSTEIAGIKATCFNKNEIFENQFFMADNAAAQRASEKLSEIASSGNSAGGIIECRVDNLRAGIGEPVFDKLDSSLAKAIMSIGAVKGIEFGTGFESARALGSENNDEFYFEANTVKKKTNNSGGVLGGISDGSPLIFRAAIKPTPSVSIIQKTINQANEETEIQIKGRHDGIIVPRAVVVVEAMAAITILDLILQGLSSRLENVKTIYCKGE